MIFVNFVSFSFLEFKNDEIEFHDDKTLDRKSVV